MDIYILKQNIPGNHKKGDAFDENGYDEKNKKTLLFKPTDEISFFTKVKEPGFKVYDTIKLNIKYTQKNTLPVSSDNRTYSLRAIELLHNRPYIIHTYDAESLTYVIKLDNPDNVTNSLYIKVKEHLLIKAELYWFVNTDGQFCKELKERFSRKEEFLKSVGNYHASKELALNWVKKIQILVKNTK